MKVYFTHSRTVPQKQLDLFLNYFERNGITVLQRNIPDDPFKMDFAEAEKMYATNVRMIRNADIVVSESSYISNDIGYDTSLALNEKKPVLVFFNMTENKDDPRHIKNVPIGIKGNKSRYLMLKEYDAGNFERSMNLALTNAKELVDTKFILIIPPEIDRYLEWNAKERGLAKAEVTRDSIEKAMKTDDKYQAYLKDNGLE